jgi:hypothetical protein
VAAPVQWTPARRPLPVARLSAVDTGRGSGSSSGQQTPPRRPVPQLPGHHLRTRGVRSGHQPSGHHRQAATVPQWTPAVRTPSPGGHGSGRTVDTAAVSTGCGITPCGGHPRLDRSPRRGSAAAVDTVCGDCRPLPSAGRAWMVGRRRPPCPMPCSGDLWPCPRRKAAVRLAPGRNPGRPADTAAVFGSTDTWVPARSAQPADIDCPDAGRLRWSWPTSSDTVPSARSRPIEEPQADRPQPAAIPAVISAPVRNVLLVQYPSVKIYR